jgi:hypothetical protein
MASKIYSEVFSPEEINSIIAFYDSKPVAAQDQYSNNKNLEYQIPDDVSYQLLNPKITKLLGKHEFATGAHKECIKPYALHVDSYTAHQDATTITTFSNNKKHNCALLIPLVEGPQYKTVTFSCYAKNNDFQLNHWVQEKNSLDLTQFPHCDARIDRLPVDIEYTWQLGDVLCWSRDQLHASSDFTQHGVTKRFLILFMA